MSTRCQIATPAVYLALIEDSVGLEFIKNYHRKSLDYNEFQGFILISLYEKIVNKSLNGSEIQIIQTICQEICHLGIATEPQKIALEAILNDEVVNASNIELLLRQLFLGNTLPLGFNKDEAILFRCGEALSVLNSDNAQGWGQACDTLNAFLKQHVQDATQSIKQKTGTDVLPSIFDELSLTERIHFMSICNRFDQV